MPATRPVFRSTSGVISFVALCEDRFALRPGATNRNGGNGPPSAVPFAYFACFAVPFLWVARTERWCAKHTLPLSPHLRALGAAKAQQSRRQASPHLAFVTSPRTGGGAPWRSRMARSLWRETPGMPGTHPIIPEPAMTACCEKGYLPSSPLVPFKAKNASQQSFSTTSRIVARADADCLSRPSSRCLMKRRS
jgi:hypothetical protein